MQIPVDTMLKVLFEKPQQQVTRSLARIVRSPRLCDQMARAFQMGPYLKSSWEGGEGEPRQRAGSTQRQGRAFPPLDKVAALLRKLKKSRDLSQGSSSKNTQHHHAKQRAVVPKPTLFNVSKVSS